VWQWLGGSVCGWVAVWIDRADRGLSNGGNFMVIGAVLIELRAFKNMSQKVNKKKATPRQSGYGFVAVMGDWVAMWQCVWYGSIEQMEICRMVLNLSCLEQY
jgi:hypothetical protein